MKTLFLVTVRSDVFIGKPHEITIFTSRSQQEATRFWQVLRANQCNGPMLLEVQMAQPWVNAPFDIVNVAEYQPAAQTQWKKLNHQEALRSLPADFIRGKEVVIGYHRPVPAQFGDNYHPAA